MQPDLIITPFGESADPETIREIPQSNPSGEPRQNASWEQGFPIVTMTPITAGGIPPEGPDMNGVLRAISRHTSFVGGGGQYKWSAEYVAAKGGYPKGAVIQANNGESSYVSMEDGNSTNFNAYPDSIGKQWEFFGGPSSYFKLQFDKEQQQRNDVFNQFLAGTAFEMPPIPFTEGAPIEISRPTQLVSYEGNLYSVKLPSSFPAILPGIWSVAQASLTPQTDPTLRQQLADPEGLSRTGFIAYGEGAIPRTGLDKARERVSVEDYGMTDGVTDNSWAFEKAFASGAKTIFADMPFYRITRQITIPDGCCLVTQGTPTIAYEVGSGDAAFVLGAGAQVIGIGFAAKGVSPLALKATAKSGIRVLSNSFDFTGFTGVVPTTLTDVAARGVDFQDCPDLQMHWNRCKGGWNDKNYNCSTEYAGRNMFRTFNVENHGQSDVTLLHNTFDDSWSPIYNSNTNNLEICHNTVRGTADTGIFERCTSGVTRNKKINFNTITNCGKGGIKFLDSNNLTGKGHNAQCIGNTVIDYARFLHTEGIFSYNYYNGTNYIKAPVANRATKVQVKDNVVLNSISDSPALGLVNISGLEVSGNELGVTYAGTRNEFVAQWCDKIKYHDNTVDNQNGPLTIYQCDKVSFYDNTATVKGRLEIEIGGASSGYTYKVYDSTIENVSEAAQVVASFGVALTNASSSVVGLLEVYNMTFVTKVPFEDGVQSTSKNMISVATAANAANTYLDNNTVIFNGVTKRQRSMFGDILHPSYYMGSKGTSVYDPASLRLTIQPSTDRVDTDYSLFNT